MTFSPASDLTTVHARARDRVAVWPMAMGLAIPLALVAIGASPLGPNFFYVVFGIPSLLLLWFLAALVAIVCCILAVRSGFRRRSLSLAVLPVLVLVAAVQPTAFVRFCCHVGDILHFEIMRPHYLAQLSQMPNGAPRLAVFNWGGMVGASTGVIYDDSDEVTLPAGRHSAAWQERAARTDLVCEGYGVEPLGGHFYLGSFPC